MELDIKTVPAVQMAIVKDNISTGHITTLNNEEPLEFVFETK